jgi:hypothetical protein
MSVHLQVQNQPSFKCVRHVVLAAVWRHVCRAIRARGCRGSAAAAGLHGLQCQAGAVLYIGCAQGAAACYLQLMRAPLSWHREWVSLTCCSCRNQAAVLEQPNMRFAEAVTEGHGADNCLALHHCTHCPKNPSRY